ncbi:PLP-dependent aminotransferase family protein [Virgibacillus sp. AGTR]|uniref:MocR-like pyridoxine biosynthesis transcription factor PdxR n=1 Tax=unclassified Virgibacillus TaxID=2620237 RepID=UPI000EF48D4B|nr:MULTISPECIES: PLP-dependent aminotransferase family protein [unclassified Virgibacillus]MCC2250613.1 PLP-dependent aminotransferase family protein [Virgibacillus sp. AGTR]QRZ18470.1 PLP-dependent aminotransferase family protein [Virgibacillus sp. AGTR]
MKWKPDRMAKKPIYKQIADYIESGIDDGTFLADKPLPSERTLANDLQVNRSTIVAAYDELQANGLIERKKGSGTTISRDIWGMEKKRIPNWNRYIEAGSFLQNLPITQRLREEMTEEDIINLASGELSEGLFPTTTLKEIAGSGEFPETLGYDHPLGNEKLRETIAAHVKEYKAINTNPSSILITSGAQQALHLVVQCLLKAGDTVAIEDPSYSYHLPVFQTAGVKTLPLPVGKHGINPDDLVSLLKVHKIRMIFLNPIFQNPTGTILNYSGRQRVIDISAKFGIPIIEDDPYSLTSFNGEKMSTLKSMDLNGNVLYISSLSKIVASGLRIGWIIGPRAVIERLSDAKQQLDFGHSAFSQRIADKFLQPVYFNPHMKRLRRQLANRRDQIISSLQFHIGDYVTFYAPEGGIHLWCRIPTKINEMHLLEEAIRSGVIYLPGSALGTRSTYIRFTFAKEDEARIDQGIKRFSEALKHFL